MRTFARLVTGVLLLQSISVAADLPLLPLPSHVEPDEGLLAIESGFQVFVTGNAVVERAAGRMLRRLQAKTGLPVPQTRARTRAGATLVIECACPVTAGPHLYIDESYQLKITPEQATLRAASASGALYGMETFLQLVQPGALSFEVPAVTIDDRPRFPWRGLMIDVSRHFFPVAVMKRQLDGMAAVKMNVLHWHLSDDQGFRVESRRFPKLNTAGSDGQYYTQAEVREVIHYAAERGIRVVPEFDMPGHTTAWLAGYPFLTATEGPFEIGRFWGIYEPVLDPTKEAVYQFLEGLIAEMAGLFPDPYFHIGGDEVNGRQWNQSEHIQAFLKAHKMLDSSALPAATPDAEQEVHRKANEALQAYFTERVQKMVEKNGKRMVGWDEVLSPTLPNTITIQSWRGPKSLAEAARQGKPVLLSNGYYLDYMLAAAQHYQVDPLGGEAATLTAEQKKLVLGGEACMWNEYNSTETIDGRIWPRTAAIAERFWSPQTVTDVASMYRRLALVGRELERVGLEHRTAQRAMLERVAGDAPLDVIETLASAVEPVKYYGRNPARHYLQSTPLNRMIDAVPPESETARRFSEDVDHYLAGDQAAGDRVRDQLERWKRNDARFGPAGTSYLLAELVPVSQQISALATAGLDAIERIRNHNYSAGWATQQQNTFAEPKAPPAELVIAFRAAVLKLIVRSGAAD